VPQIDVKPLDLLDEHENGLPGRPHFVPGVERESFSPGAERLELLFVQP
jgi:hypothetical protein